MSTVGKRSGLAPGTRSGLWSHMAEAIDALQPQLVVIENVRGLLSSPAVRASLEGNPDAQRNPDHATPALQPFATWNPTRGVWETSQLDLSGQPAPYSAIWPTCGMTRNGSAFQRPLSALLTRDSASSSLLIAKTLFRTPLATDSTRGGELLDRVRARRGSIGALPSDHRPHTQRTGWLAEQEQRTRDSVVPDRGHLHRWGHYARAIVRWEHITGRPAQTPRS